LLLGGVEGGILLGGGGLGLIGGGGVGQVALAYTTDPSGHVFVGGGVGCGHDGLLGFALQSTDGGLRI
jgi:hypothetical protein